MKTENISELKVKYEGLRNYFDSGATRAYDFRLKALTLLRKSIIKHSDEITSALKNDLNKPEFESYLSDVGVVIKEIDQNIKNLVSWMKPKRVPTPFSIFPGYNSQIHYEPKGVVMIFAPWNYPVNLVFIPLVGAISAGNTVMVKPAHETEFSCNIIDKIIKEVFDPGHVNTVLGEGSTLGPLLLDNFRFDHIFFTGSQKVGSFVMSKAAEKLVPVTLELGGKNPAVVDKDCNINISVNRLVWGKFFSNGQTCIAPDFLLVHEEIYDNFIEAVKKRILEVYGADPKTSPIYARIINVTRCKKVVEYISQGEILYGGKFDIEERYVEPTLIRVRDLTLPIMNEEIFGPVWPVVTWKTYEDLQKIIRQNRYPLSCYIFSNNRKTKDFLIQNIEFGNGCINDNLVHFANSSLPFGGIQNSGFGRYHGRFSFETFSHSKSMVTTLSWLDHPLKYAPYTKWKKMVSKWFLQ